MPIYHVTYTVEVTGTVAVEADSSEAACASVKYANPADLDLSSVLRENDGEHVTPFEVDPDDSGACELLADDDFEEDPASRRPSKGQKRADLRSIPLVFRPGELR